MRVAAVAVILLLAGCMTLSGGGCDLWSSDLMLGRDAFGIVGARSPEPIGAPEGLPLENATLRGRWGNYHLRSVVWRESEASDAPIAAIGWLDERKVQMAVPNATSDADARAAMQRAVDAFGLATPENMSHAYERMERRPAPANAPPRGSSAPGLDEGVLAGAGDDIISFIVQGIELDLGSAFEEVRELPPPSPPQYGRYVARGGPWTFIFGLPTRAFEDRTGGEWVHGNVDTEGQARVTVVARRALDEAEAIAAIDGGLAAIGLPRGAAAAGVRHEGCSS